MYVITLPLFYLRTSLFRSRLHNIFLVTFITYLLGSNMFKLEKILNTCIKRLLKKHAHCKFFSGMKCLHLWRKRVNTKKHFPKDRGNFILGRVSSRDVISCVNNLLESSTYWKIRKPDFSFHKGVFQKQPPRGVPEKRCIFSEHFFLRTSLCGCFWVFLNLSMELFFRNSSWKTFCQISL